MTNKTEFKQLYRLSTLSTDQQERESASHELYALYRDETGKLATNGCDFMIWLNGKANG